MNLPDDPKIRKIIEEENLRYVSDKSPGFFRQRVGKHFKFYDTKGQQITDPKIQERIGKLVIPPAWEEVWISPTKNGHIQATGLDEKKRKQYIYHPDWVKVSQQKKFDKMIDFGLTLPKLRSKVRYGLSSREMDKKKILATIVWLLENTFIRVGNEEYSKENDSFGLTTLRNKHVDIDGNTVTFSFKGKSGVYHEHTISHPNIAKTLKKCVELPGFELFQFIDEDGDRHAVDSADVNLFLKDLTGEDFTAKDFRTWGGTHLSANHFYEIGDAKNKTVSKKNINETVKHVASHLQNTTAVCRNYYIHPTVIETYEDKILVPHFDTYNRSRPKKPDLSWDEIALIKLLQTH